VVGTIRSSTNLKTSIEAGHPSFTENVATANTISLARKSRRAARRVAEESIEETKKGRLGLLFFFRPQTNKPTLS
jgi:hypothetical protein